jgi:uncharacterized protein YabE (DUF348 family)
VAKLEKTQVLITAKNSASVMVIMCLLTLSSMFTVGTVQSDKNKINTTNETEYMKEMVMKNQNGGNLNQETIEST